MILLYKLVFGRILESYMYVCIRYLVDISERKGQLPRQYYVSCREVPFGIVIFASLTMFFGKFDVLSTIPRQLAMLHSKANDISVLGRDQAPAQRNAVNSTTRRNPAPS